ncbi:MAG TPA: glycosyltransferase family 39 protein [Vicinamibacterales bacterium]
MRKVALTVLLAGVVAAGVRWGTFVAGGSDSFCYAHQAERWASGRLQVVEPLALEAPWPEAPLSFAPAGHVPSPTQLGALAPICPAGLSLAMAPFRWLGGRDAIFLVVPLFGALLVGATFIAGARFGARVGLAAAAIVACSPVFLYQLMQPMSDVPAAALWVLAVASATGTATRGPLVAGVAAGAAILTRPNLLPLGVPIALFLLFRPERAWRDRLSAALACTGGASVGCVAVALIQNAFYGSPFSSGYGSLEVLFRAEHVGPNASHYLSWMSEAHTPVWLVALAAPLVLPGALSALYAAMFVVNLACYLPYVTFAEWAYVRFLLPTIPLVLVLMVATIDAACRRLLPRAAAPVLAVVTLVLAVVFLRAASEHRAFRLHVLEARYARAGAFVGERLPANALVITRWQSGSVRYYSGRRTLVWDGLDPAWLDRAIVFARERGLVPFLLFERWEEPLFRQRFAGSPLAALDWPPAVEIAGQVRIYRPEDRDRYARGLPVTTEYAR